MFQLVISFIVPKSKWGGPRLLPPPSFLVLLTFFSLALLRYPVGHPLGYSVGNPLGYGWQYGLWYGLWNLLRFRSYFPHGGGQPRSRTRIYVVKHNWARHKDNSSRLYKLSLAVFNQEKSKSIARTSPVHFTAQGHSGKRSLQVLKHNQTQRVLRTHNTQGEGGFTLYRSFPFRR